MGHDMPDATCINFGFGASAVKAIDELIKWCGTTRNMSVDDFDY